MTKRKDPEPEANVPQDQSTIEPVAPEAIAADPVAGEPFVVTYSSDPPPAPEPTSPEPAPQVVVRRASILPPLLGGAIAAVGGFALSHFDFLSLRPEQDPAALAAVSQQVADLQTRIAALDKLGSDLSAVDARIARLESAPTPAAPDLSRLDDLDQRLAAIEAMPSDGAASSAAVTAKLAELERRLAESPQSASPELQQQLDAALTRLDEAEATASARAEEAAAATAAAERTKALDTLAARVTAGEPFLPELRAVNDPELTNALSSFAESGVATLAQLQSAFPDAARAALQAARETSTDTGWGDRFLDFLASQSGARPLTPLEGDTPEAILSRADFALSEGRVGDAVAELKPLDALVKAPLDAWLVQAEAHLAAASALQAARGE